MATNAKYLIFAFASLISWSANADTITVGSATTYGGNCLPFSCQGSHEYQQIYSASAFGLGSLNLTAISFYVDPFALTVGGGTSLTTPSFDLSLSTTSKNVGGLNLNYANNIGVDSTTVFSGTISVTNAQPGQEIRLSFFDAFSYNPAHGNLLLTITSADGFTTQNFTSGSFYLQSENPSALSSRLTSTIYNLQQDNSALVTSFTTAVPEISPVPGPIVGAGLPGILMVIVGFIGWQHRRRAISA
jgi:hypothetical protein